MRLLGRAAELEAQGRSIVYLELAEPDFPTPEPIVEAGRRALAEGRTRYTPARGLAALREDLAGYYAGRYGVQVDPACILVTPGASGALQLVFQAVLEPGDRVLLCDPSYPCYRQVLRLLSVEPVAVPVGPQTNYQLTVDLAAEAWVPGVRAVVVASPSNPTGSSLDPAVMAGLCRERGAAFIVDEIYQGLTYEAPDRTALALGSEDLYVINSFSKYFGMTGWRLGWLVGPADAVSVMDRMAQNLFLAANTPAQYAARAALAPATRPILDGRALAFRQRRDRHRSFCKLCYTSTGRSMRTGSGVMRQDRLITRKRCESERGTPAGASKHPEHLPRKALHKIAFSPILLSESRGHPPVYAVYLRSVRGI
ncbi:aminotransferase class I/II-fold pyridoxal phosphate-dependent enzyme [uncultured Lamprocystis sp.]|jgi:aspartate/methionine/tyrosine aminotransferase|uniref:aminotransferase class I/II-fold pyridoxal phosphate-dependent enzyme n=3 Tax=uncultured Lamprocystis sp. TaxID=543132 RepID=UPI0025EE914B|nr:aminotransferase class I/II-fold pyridoxal phosphate-dependent enzyme [uncultured Lamprocystis sp.]